jgi:hypothetical protein
MCVLHESGIFATIGPSAIQKYCVNNETQAWLQRYIARIPVSHGEHKKLFACSRHCPLPGVIAVPAAIYQVPVHYYTVLPLYWVGSLK